jgi:hypothetical protein
VQIKLMNTKIVMGSSAVMLALTGILLTFAPDEVLHAMTGETDRGIILLVQAMGALYFGFAMLNWMAKGSLIGGIYNRPIATANFSHFLIAGLAFLKALLAAPKLPLPIWVAGITYLILAALFTIILFTHPVKSPTPDHK